MQLQPAYARSIDPLEIAQLALQFGAPAMQQVALASSLTSCNLRNAYFVVRAALVLALLRNACLWMCHSSAKFWRLFSRLSTIDYYSNP